MAFEFFEKLRCISPFKRNALCFFLGLAGAAALAPISWPVLFLVGFSGLVFLLRGAENLKAAFAQSWFYALGYHLAGLYWISASLFIDIGRYFWVLPFSLLALPTYLALLFAGAALLVQGLRKKPVMHCFAIALAVFGAELLRSWLMGGFPWNLFGYIWSETPALIQSVSLFGIHGLSLLTLLLGALASLLYERMTREGWVALASIALVFSALGLWGEIRLQNNPTTYVESVNLRLVQPAIAQSERKTQEQRIEGMTKYIQLSKQPSAAPLTAIIWPETASPYFLAQYDDAREALKPLVPPGGALITGTPSRVEENGIRRFYNSLVVLNDAGAIAGIYDKSHLVPFGEFVPFRDILKTIPVAADVIGNGDFSPGTGAKTLRAPGLPPFSTMICYEAIFSGAVVDENDPPQMLLQITNDAWFGNTSGPYQHLAMARVRAIEEGLPLIRVANSGISAVIDPLGRMIQSFPLNASGIIDSRVPTPSPQRTLFSEISAFHANYQ